MKKETKNDGWTNGQSTILYIEQMFSNDERSKKKDHETLIYMYNKKIETNICSELSWNKVRTISKKAAKKFKFII